MSGRRSTAEKVLDLVIAIIEKMTGLQHVDPNRLLSDLGISTVERELLYRWLLAAAPTLSKGARAALLSGDIRAAFQRARTVTDVVDGVVELLPAGTSKSIANVGVSRGGGDTKSTGGAKRQAKRGKPPRKSAADVPSDPGPAPRGDEGAAETSFNREFKITPVEFDAGESADETLAHASSIYVPEHAAVPQETSVAAPDNERRISIWIGEGETRVERALEIGRTYVLNFKVGQPVAASLVSGADTGVPAKDVPAGGLWTDWVVAARDAELAAGTAGSTVDVTTIDGAQIWSGRFSFLIPQDGDSAVPQLKIKPLKPGPRLDVLVTVRGDIYRQFQILLTASQIPGMDIVDPARVAAESRPAPTGHMGVRTSHEWTTPYGILTIGVAGPMAFVQGTVGTMQVNKIEAWTGSQALLSGPIENVREAAEDLRANWEAHLDDIPAADLADRLRRWSQRDGYGPEYDWRSLGDHADAGHRQQWARMAVSPELRKLAFHGQRLFHACFANRSNLRTWLGAVAPGSRLDISWLPASGPGYIPHVPWGLMYVANIPPEGEPIDPMGFLGMRCRLAYTSHDVDGPPRSLGALDETHRAHFLYWGEEAGDVTGEEARWQRSQWGGWKNQVFVPQSAQNAKAELLKLLNDPRPAPTSLLYLYCQCSVGKGNNPVLTFGSTNDPANTVLQTDFGTSPLADRPFVFANACTTAAGGAYMANELEEAFFSRECRAYLGTETKVPIVFASRFAAIFFHFFYRLLDPAPMAAGEAVAQTRLFLWTHYRNIGGLFYSHVNMYDLFVARDDEVRALRV